MLDTTSTPAAAESCSRITRRAFLQGAASAPLALGLPGMAPGTNPLITAPKAKSVLMVFLFGGPSHLDLFDPKPLAPVDYRGPLQPIPTQTPGVNFTELLPRLAARSNQFAVVRTMSTVSDHSFVVLTGRGQSDPGNQPNFGSIVARHRKHGSLVPFVLVAPPGDATFYTKNASGFLGPAYAPFIAECSSDGKIDIGQLKLLQGLSPQRLAARRSLWTQLNAAPGANASNSAWNEQWEMAYQLLNDPRTGKVFDLSAERAKVRAAYGHTSFGHGLLLGRRLVEAGVPYVWVNWSNSPVSQGEGSWSGWDTHTHHFERMMNWHGPILDRALSALFDDLADRGLLDSTLVVVTGEMGRSPKIDGAGRNHWGTGSSLWAGAGVQGGKIVGVTDRYGGYPVTEPVTPAMMGTTIVDLAGVNVETRAQMKVLEGGRVIHELF